jgi:hypothetical protein
MKNLHKVKVEPLISSQATHYAQQCIISDSTYIRNINSNQTHSGHLGVFPHNSSMPQLSSADRLIMAANDMVGALKHTHPIVPFNKVGDDTISALTTLEAILKMKMKTRFQRNT